MEKQLISDKGISVLNAIAAGNHMRFEIASHLKVTIPTVNGSLNALRRNGLVEIDEDVGSVTLTPDATPFIKKAGAKRTSVVSRSESKMARARELYNNFVAQGRAAVLAEFRKLGLTKAGASTYYQTINSGVLAYQKSKGSAKKSAAKH